MEKNFYDMTGVTGKSISDAKRIQAQTADFLKNYDRNLQESFQAEEDKKMNAAMSGARFGYAANIARSNNRINRLNEEIRYTNNSSIVGMTEMVAQVVEKALLLDENEFVKIYPEYKEDIRSIVKDFLKEGEINPTIIDNRTLALMEYVSRTLPGVREGVTLTEDELSNYIAVNKPIDIDRSIRNLAGDVSTRVATLMEKEQKKADQIEKDVKRAKAKEAKAATAEDPVEDLIAALEAGEISETDLDEMVKNGEISQDTYDEIIGVYEDAASGEMDATEADNGDAPVDENDPAAPAEAPVTTSAEAPVEEDPNAAPMGMPKKQVQMLPDGTMNINIYESFDFVRETPRCGLIESLAVNEATNMLNKGKSYDGDLCLAKAIMYVTITEAMDELGLMNVDDKKYAEIISAAGGNLNEKCGTTSKKAISKKQNEIPEGKIKKTDIKKSLNESVIMTQYAPARNDTYSPDSLAERIRQKRLNEQQTLHD